MPYYENEINTNLNIIADRHVAAKEKISTSLKVLFEGFYINTP